MKVGIRILSAILCIPFLLSAYSWPVSADEIHDMSEIIPVSDGGKADSPNLTGQNTALLYANTVEIFTPEEFIAIADYPGDKYILRNNINLDGFDTSRLHNTVFSGILDGCGYTVSGFSVGNTYNGRAGLFNSVTGTIINLTVNGDVSLRIDNNSISAGILCGQLSGAYLFQVNAIGSVTLMNGVNGSNVAAGGMFGYGAGTLENCHVSASVSISSNDGNLCGGGIAGNASGYFIYCSFGGEVDVNSQSGTVSAGGISPFSSYVEKSVVSGTVEGYSSTGSCLAVGVAGGIESTNSMSVSAKTDSSAAIAYGCLNSIGSNNQGNVTAYSATGNATAAGASAGINTENHGDVRTTSIMGYSGARGIEACDNGENYGSVTAVSTSGEANAAGCYGEVPRMVNHGTVTAQNTSGNAYAFGVDGSTQCRNNGNIKAVSDEKNAHASGLNECSYGENHGSIEAIHTDNDDTGAAYAAGVKSGEYCNNHGDVDAKAHGPYSYASANGCNQGNVTFNYGSISSDSSEGYSHAGGAIARNSENHGKVSAYAGGHDLGGTRGNAIAYGVNGVNSLNTSTVTAETLYGAATAYGAQSGYSTGSAIAYCDNFIVNHDGSGETGQARAYNSFNTNATLKGYYCTASMGEKDYAYVLFPKDYCPVHHLDSIRIVTEDNREECGFNCYASGPVIVSESSSKNDYSAVDIEPNDGEDVPAGMFRIKLINIETSRGIKGASVTLGNITNFTDAGGNAIFSKPSSNSVRLEISADGYHDIIYSNYGHYRKKSSDTIEMIPSDKGKIIPLTCNDDSISTEYSQINVQADLVAEIAITGAVPSGIDIEKFALEQNGRILAESFSGEFSIHNSEFEEKQDIIAHMYTDTGEDVTEKLKIYVISFGFSFKEIKFPNKTITLPDSLDLLGGLDITIGADKLTSNVSVENEALKIGLNVEVLDADSALLQNRFKQLFEKYKKALEKVKKKEQWTCSLGGYLIVNVGNTGVKSITSEFFVVIQHESKFSRTIMVPVSVIAIPVYGEIIISVDGSLIFKELGYDLEHSEVILPDIYFGSTGSITAGGGLGVSEINGGLYGKLSTTADLSLNLKPNPLITIEKWVGSGELGVYAKGNLLGVNFDIKKPIFKHSIVLYDRNAVTREHLMNSLYDPAAYTLASGDTSVVRSDWADTVHTGVLQSGVSDTAAPQLVTAGNVTMMMYQDNIGTDGTSRLLYSLLTDKGWTAPESVDNNELPDADFKLASDGSNIYVVYTEAKRVITGSEDLADYAAVMEIAAAKYDAENKCFVQHTSLTDDDTYDVMADVAVVNGVPTAVWVKNSDNHAFAMTANNVVYISKYYDGSWHTQALTGTIPAVVCIAVGQLGDTAAAAVICDRDNVFLTLDDRYLTLYTGETEYTYENSVVNNILFAGNELYRNTGEAIEKISSPGEEFAAVKTLTGAESSDFDVIIDNEDTVIFYTVYSPDGDNGSRNLYVSRNGEEAVPVTDEDVYVDSYDAVFQDGKLLTVYRRMAVAFEEEDMITNSDLCTGNISMNPALRILDTSVDYEDLMDGNNVISINMIVQNTGLTDMEGLSVIADGTVCYTEMDAVLASGASKEITFTYTMPENTPQTIRVSATAENGVKALSELRTGYSDFSISVKQVNDAEKIYANVYVVNNGNVGNDAALYLRSEENGIAFYRNNLYLEPGEGREITIEITDPETEIVYAQIFGPEEYISVDNSDSCTVSYSVSFDINNDGYVNMADAAELNRMVAEGDHLNAAFDFDGNGIVDTADAKHFLWKIIHENVSH